MKKIFIILALSFFIAQTSFAENILEKNLNSGYTPRNILKINLEGNHFENIYSSVYFSDFENENKLKVNRLNNILQKIDKNFVKESINKNFFQIYGSEYFCGIVGDLKTYDCAFYDEKEYFTNTEFRNFYKINSLEEKNITFEIFPFSPDYFIYDTHYFIENQNLSGNPNFDKNFSKKAKITFFDEILDIYNLEAKINNKNIGNFEKKYKLVEYEKGYFMYIPYYSTKINLTKGENFLELNFEKYTDIKKIKNYTNIFFNN